VEINHLNALANQRQVEIGQLKAAAEQRQAETDQHKAEAEQGQAEVHQLKTQLEKSQRQNSDLNVEVERYRMHGDQLDALRTDLANNKQEIAVALERSTRLANKNRTATRRVAELREENAYLKNENAIFLQQRDQMRGDLQAMRFSVGS
jgi:chromosome segregation ATPase